MYTLYARRAASPFAAMGWYHCDKAYDEFLSAASSRTRSCECGLNQACLGILASPSRPAARTRTELVRAADGGSLLATLASWRKWGLCAGSCCFIFQPGCFCAQRRRSGLSPLFKPSHLSLL